MESIEREFNRIKKEYKGFYQELFSNGRLNCRDTGIGFWGCSGIDSVFRFFKNINLGSYKRFIDLGSGDGVVVMVASLFTDATGIEFDKELYEKAIDIKKRLGSEAKFLNLDFMSTDISGYDFIYINPDKSLSRNGVESKLLGEMEGTLAIYNNLFHPSLLRKGKTIWHDQVPMTLWHK